MPEKSIPNGLLYGVLFAFILALIGALVINTAQRSLSNHPVLGTVPKFTFTERSGSTVSTEDMAGSLWLVDFIFTNCQGACPVMSGHMSDFYKLYAHSDKIRFLSISVDPDRDTLEVLQKYAIQQGVNDERWLFARGQIDYVVEICEKGFLLPAEDLPMGHSTKYVLIDHKGSIRGYYDALYDPDIELVKTHIQDLAKDI